MNNPFANRRSLPTRKEAIDKAIDLDNGIGHVIYVYEVGGRFYVSMDESYAGYRPLGYSMLGDWYDMSPVYKVN